MGARLARAWHRRGWRFGAARKAEPMHLADHRVAGDAAEFGSDLTRGEAVGPQFLQQLDAFVSPAHEQLLAFVAAGSFGQNPLPGLGSDRLAPTRTPDTDLLRNLSAARNVVFDNRKPTIWRESGARVGSYRVHMFRPPLPNRPHVSPAIVQTRTVGRLRTRANCG